MKKYIPFLLLIVAAISSCCKKTACLEVAGVPVTFYGYRSSELDTLLITGYGKGTGFSLITRETQIDTVQDSPGEDSVYVLKLKTSNAITVGALPGSALSDQHEWQIYIPALKQTIRISNYGYHSYTCHSCGFSKGTEVRSLSTVDLNGASVKVDAVAVNK